MEKITMKQWNDYGGSFTDLAKNGDIVDSEIVDYFNEVLPPHTKKTDDAQIIQCSEPLRSDGNGFLYITFIKFNEKVKQKAQDIKFKMPVINQWQFFEALHVDKIFN